MKIKNFHKLVVLEIAILLLALLLVHRNSVVVFAADVHNNDLVSIEVWQWNGSAWNMLANFTSTGQTVRVVADQPINFTVQMKFNSTLASSTSEAISYTRIYMNITDGGSIWNNEELNNTSCNLVGSFYYLKERGHWNETGKPTAAVTYTCTVKYQGYY